MPFGKGRRKLLLGLGTGLLLLLALLFCCPIWFPWLLRPLARHAGARYRAYQRLGYSRFRLLDLSVTNDSETVHAGTVQGYVPTVWLWNLIGTQWAASGPFAQVNDWAVELLPSHKEASPVNSQVQDLAATLRALQRWLPAAVLVDGTVQSGDTKISVAKAVWRAGTLEAQIKLPDQLSDRDLTLSMRPGHPFDLDLACQSLDLNSSLIVSTNGSGFDVNNSTFWESNRFDLQAHFGARGQLPETAILQATNLFVPAKLLSLAQYEGITGALSARWQEGHFELNVHASARPASAETNWPPADLNLQVRGDTNTATVEKFALNSAFLQSSLSDPLSLIYSSPYVKGPARLTLTADLAQQHWLALDGRMTGTAQLSPGPGKFPTGTLRLTGTQIGDPSLKASTIEVAVNLDWPKLQLVNARATFDDGSAATIAGQFDFESSTVAAGNVRFEGPLARRWLPSGYSFQNLTLAGSFDGPLQNLAHSGRVEVSQITSPGLKPLGLKFQWNGFGEAFEHFFLQLSSTNGALTATGALSLRTNQTELKLDSVELQTNSLAALRLTEPAMIRYSKPSGSSGTVLTSPLHLTGPAGDFDAQSYVQWPQQGALQIRLEHLSAAFLAPFVDTELPHLEVSRLAARATWTNTPINLELNAVVTGSFAYTNALIDTSRSSPKDSLPSAAAPALPAQLLSTPLKLELNLTGDAHGLVLSNLLVNTTTSTVAVAHGFLPVSVNPSDNTNLVKIVTDQPLQLNASIRPEAFFWHAISQVAGIQLDNPNVDVDLTGTWRAPAGKIVARAQAIQLKKSTLTNLALSDLRLVFNLDRNKASLTQGQVLVQGQRVSLTGELPLDEAARRRLEQKQLPDWNQATAQLRIDNAKLAAFEPLFPQVLAPQGELNVDLQLHAGLDLQGALILRRARTRPLGNTAPLGDINVTLHFHDRVLALESASANLSGARIDLAGRADLRGTNWMEAGLPPFALTLRGTNVPLAREPEYIIRSDLDLAVVKTNDAPPLVTGKANLRESFYLSDLSALVPGKVEAPAARPPYFSIDSPTVADWRLGVTVEGVRWLKLRTSLFNGEVSANLRLEGTLKDPIALGGLTVDSGLVRFPFANLQVQQGMITLTSQNPYRPQLLVRASSKQYGYDIRMDVTGTADSPIIQFTSNPSLSSEQILLMITAGQLPQGTFTLTPQQRAQTVALFLGRDLLSKLGLGDQSQDRLTISSGEEISVQNRPTYRVEYKLTPRWSVTGEYDRFGDFNAGLKWRVYSK